jgi:hypothetical protein
MGSFQPTMAGGGAAAGAAGAAGAAPTAAYTGNIDIAPPKIAASKGMFTGTPPEKDPGLFAKGGYLERNQGMIGGVAKGVGSVLGGLSEAGAMSDQTELARQKFEYEKEQQMDEQERRRRMAELLMPLFTQMQSRQSSRG